MSRHRLFCSRRRLEDGVFTIAGEEAHHGINVCRLRAGNEVFVFTEQGSEFRCEIVAARKGMLQARIEEKLEGEVESPLEITLVQATPKSAKLEQIIVHATELGVSRLVLVRSERSFAGERMERWRRMALEATKQSGRRTIPRIEPPVPLEELELDQFGDALRLLACEQPCAGPLASLAEEHKRKRSVVLAAGPEGGFTGDEMKYLLDNGFFCVSMGPRVLRTETASLALISVLQYMLGDWQPLGNIPPKCGQ